MSFSESPFHEEYKEENSLPSMLDRTMSMGEGSDSDEGEEELFHDA